MSKESSNFSCRPLTESDSVMRPNQLIDSLTSHISLYTSSTTPSPNTNPSPRSSILKWFSSLTVHQRQAYLTSIDPKFVQILTQMLGRVAKRGRGTFIILPDLPSPDLPGLCYRQSRGLLSRAAESNVLEQRVFDSVRLFSSREGDDVRECSVSVNCLDTMTFGEELVGDFDLFVETMDGVSNGGFLRGGVSDLGDDWVELDWLKAKGYYSIAAFVANRLELSLRLSWLSSNNGKTRGVKLKEKVGMVSIAANVFWRKKACVDWWWNLDPEQRRKALAAVLGKSARTLSQEILMEANKATEDNVCAFPVESGLSMSYNCKGSYGRAEQNLASDAEFATIISWDSLLQMPRHIANPFKYLFILKGVATMVLSCREVDYRVPFFSSLSSVNTVSDCIHRKLRGFLTVLYLDFTKCELLEEKRGKSLPNKVKERSGSCPRKKKGKSHDTKRVNLAGCSCKDLSLSDKPSKEISRITSLTDNSTSSKSRKMHFNPQGDQIHEETPLPEVKMEVVQAVCGKGNDTAKKSKRRKRKNRSSVVNHANQKNSQWSSGASSLSGVSQDGAARSLEGSHNSTTMNVSSDDLKGKYIRPSDFCAPANNLRVEDEVPESSKRDATGSADNLCCTSSGCCQSFKYGMENPSFPSTIETSKSKLSCKGTSDWCSTDAGNTLSNENISIQQSGEMTGAAGNSAVAVKQGRASISKDEAFTGERRVNFSETANGSSLEPQSQDWPSVSYSYFPSANSHLPPATDRLHLDVGRNWQNHFRKPFLPTIRQTRNSPTESNCKQILARPLPMSLDWPPMVRSACGLASTLTCSYDARRQSPFHQGFAAHSVHLNMVTNSDEKKYFGDLIDKPGAVNAQELGDEFDGHWISEEELELHGVSGLDYNQYFGGGIMYWDPSDLQGSGFSRPPSLSSDDSFWTWQEADMNRTVDDMVAFSSSYSTNGLASPTASPFCSPFDPLSSGHQTLSFVRTGSDVPGTILRSSSAITDSAAEDEASGSFTSLAGDVDGKSVDSPPYPVLRPIIIPNPKMSRSKRNHELKSPCVPPTRAEPRLKRPPSPVVLCVPRAPRPPPPSPVGESRKHRGFPTVRSGSSSPRQWGVRGWYHDSGNLEESCLCMDGAEIVLPPWRSNNLSVHPIIKPLPGSLLQDRLIAISQLARDQEHPDVAFPLQPPDLQNCAARNLMHNLLHDEIDSFCKQVALENLSRKPYLNWAVKRVTRSLQVLWPRSRTNIFGSNATGLSLPTSDVDLVVCLPPVRNLEPIKEAGILEGRNGIKETCLQHAARYLANQEWVKNDSLKTVENTALPIIMLEVEVPRDLVTSSASAVQSPKDETADMTGEQCNRVDDHLCVSEDSTSPRCSTTDFEGKLESKTVRVDISFKSASHTGLQTAKLVRELTEQFPAATPLALLLKQFLADRSLDHSYSGGLSSYCLILLITRFLQHEHHLGRSINQNFGSLLLDFLYFFGNVFDPRQMRVSVRGSGLYMKRERGYSIDPIHVDDPLFPTNNVGRNCFRIHQCIKAFSEAYAILEQELSCLPSNANTSSGSTHKLLRKIIPNIDSS